MVAHSKSSKKYCDLFDDTLKLWGQYSETYCSVLEKYYDALEEKRASDITPLNKIKKTDLDAFPVITLFCIQDEDEAIEYILNLTQDKLVFVHKQMTDFIKSKLFEDLQTKAFDFKQAVRKKKARKSLYAMSPDACGCGRRLGKHRVESDFNY